VNEERLISLQLKAAYCTRKGRTYSSNQLHKRCIFSRLLFQLYLKRFIHIEDTYEQIEIGVCSFRGIELL